MGGPGIEPGLGVVGTDPAAVLQSAGPGPERLAGCQVITGSERDDVSASEIIRPIQLREPAWGAFRDEVGPDALPGIAQGATHDLDDLSVAEIDAGTKHGRRLQG